MVSNCAEIIRTIKSAIETGNEEIVFKELQRLPIAFLPKEQSNLLLAMFVNANLINFNSKILRFIIDFFDKERIRTDPLPANTELFTNLHIHPDVLKLVIDVYPDKSVMDYFFDLINSLDDEIALQTAIALTKYFPEMTEKRELWERLCVLTDPFDEEEYHNPMLRCFFEQKFEALNVVMTRPDYIKNFPKRKIEPISFELPSVAEAVDLLLDNLQHLNLQFKNPEGKVIPFTDPIFKDMLICQYSLATLTEKINMLKPFRELPEFDDSPLFQKYGPVNTFYRHEYIESDHPCRYGCRMLLCNEFEDDDTDFFAENYYQKDWFTKKCEKCNKIIPFKHYALRLPLLQGGWKGCYCLDCFETLPDNPLLLLMVEIILEQLNTIGIRDR